MRLKHDSPGEKGRPGAGLQVMGGWGANTRVAKALVSQPKKQKRFQLG